MVMKALNQKMLRDLWNLRAQTLATSVLIICAVALFVSTRSAYQSLQAARDSYYNLYQFADVFVEFKRASSEVVRKIENLPDVEVVTKRIIAKGLVTVPTAKEPATGHFISLESGKQPQLNKLHLLKGKLPEDGNELEIVVYEGFAEAHKLKLGNTLYLTIEGNAEEAKVVGIALSPEFVYALSPAAPLPDDLHFGIFWMTEKWLQRLSYMEDGFNSINLKLSEGALVSKVKGQLDNILRPYGSLGAYGRDRQISNMFVEDEIAQQKISAIFIPSVFLAIATFLINIIASRLISIHRSQIAALKAMGYSTQQVVGHYLKLILAMTMIGTLPGIMLGVVLGRWMSNNYQSYFRFSELNFSVSPESALLGILAGALPGLLGAVGSLRMIARLAPAEAMRPLAPPSFHASIFDRLKLHQRLSIMDRMVVRNLLLKPLRLLLIILSLSAASGVIITSNAWTDIVTFLLRTQFQRLQREDLSLNFLRPRQVSIIQDLLKIPGVISAEGYRNVPVRLHYLNHRREVSLLGWPAEAKMRQLLNQDLEKINIDTKGIYLGQFFKQKWNMKPGDLIEVEPLEGSHKRYPLKVAGFTDEYIGLSAYMKINELWKLLDESKGYNLVTVKTDPEQLRNVYSRLMASPEIESVNLKEALYQGFWNSFGKIIRTMTFILATVSFLVSWGIIFNTFRVSFSEKSWELASLRVLGLSPIEVASLILTEIAVQVLLSLIPGCLFGLALTHLSLTLIHTETFGFPVIIEPGTYALAILTVTLVFLSTSWMIIGMSKKLKAAEALKSRE